MKKFAALLLCVYFLLLSLLVVTCLYVDGDKYNILKMWFSYHSTCMLSSIIFHIVSIKIVLVDQNEAIVMPQLKVKCIWNQENVYAIWVNCQPSTNSLWKIAAANSSFFQHLPQVCKVALSHTVHDRGGGTQVCAQVWGLAPSNFSPTAHQVPG